MTEWSARQAATGVLLLLVVIGSLRSCQQLAVIVAAGVTVIIADRCMRSTSWPLLIPALIGALAVAELCSGRASNIGWFAICVLTGRCALQAGWAIAGVFMTGAIALFGFEWIVVSDDPGWTTWIVGTVFTTVVCLLFRRQYQLLGELRVAQAGLADRARAEERLRISRELHDVIAHSLVVSLLHVSSARLAVDENPAEAAESLAEAERLGRQSLTEVRQAVGLLRVADTTAGGLTPLPGTAQLPALIDVFRRAGVRVSYQVDGDLAGFTATAGLTVYRILQEALTNAARHAPGADTSVRIQVGPAGAELRVDNPSPPITAYAHGFGLSSMRERAEALGGTLEAGPSPTGWHVLALLPRQPLHDQPPRAQPWRAQPVDHQPYPDPTALAPTPAPASAEPA